jgi:hypothetical protein
VDKTFSWEFPLSHTGVKKPGHHAELSLNEECEELRSVGTNSIIASPEYTFALHFRSNIYHCRSQRIQVR